MMVVPRDIEFPRVTNCTKNRQVRIFFWKKPPRKMIANLTSRRKEFSDDFVDEVAAGARQMEKYKFVGYEHCFSILRL
jgi:hypothetical protein